MDARGCRCGYENGDNDDPVESADLRMSSTALPSLWLLGSDDMLSLHLLLRREGTVVRRCEVRSG